MQVVRVKRSAYPEILSLSPRITKKVDVSNKLNWSHQSGRCIQRVNNDEDDLDLNEIVECAVAWQQIRILLTVLSTIRMRLLQLKSEQR